MIFQLQPKYKERDAWEKLLDETGFQVEALEISTPDFMNRPGQQVILDWYRSLGCVYSVHGSYVDSNPVSSGPLVRKISRERSHVSCEQALYLGARNVVFHSSAFPFLRGAYLEDWAEQSAEFYMELAQEYHLNIYVENAQDIDPAPLALLMEKVHGSNVKVCLDLGHANYSRKPIQDWVERLDGKLGYFHLSDNLGEFDDHLPLGTGTIDWDLADRLLYRRNGQVPVTLETGGIEQTRESIAFLKEHGYFGLGQEEGHGIVRPASHMKAPVTEADDPDARYGHTHTIDALCKLNDRLEERNKRLYDAFGRFLSDEIVGQLLDTPGGMDVGGREQFMTILMSDLRGFSALCETVTGEELIRILNHYLGAMLEVIRDYRGTVLEFVGDSILATFGAPVHARYHAGDAVAAAIQMQNAMESVNQWNREQGYPELSMGIGIHSGKVIIGNIGSERHTKFGIVGQAVNLCSRIESYTVAGQILISPATKDLLDVPIEVAETLQILPKGMKTSIEVTHVTGIGAPYELNCEFREQQMSWLVQPEKIRFVLIHDKHADTPPQEGEILAVSSTGAVIRTDAGLDVYDDLQIDIGGSLICKVKCAVEEGWKVIFTSKPPHFDIWRTNL